MNAPYQNTISGLLKKREELMDQAQSLREDLAKVGNDIEALDRTLAALGHTVDCRTFSTRGNRVVYFHRDELRRWLLNELREAKGPISSRDLAEKIIGLEGKDCADRALRYDMVKRVGKSLKLLRKQELAVSARNAIGSLVWRLGQPRASPLKVE